MDKHKDILTDTRKGYMDSILQSEYNLQKANVNKDNQMQINTIKVHSPSIYIS